MIFSKNLKTQKLPQNTPKPKFNKIIKSCKEASNEKEIKMDFS